ncbi:MAG: hypothetical protein FJ125_09975, partial [Deltaproteobacteria bacterium]|nr:hypothetical protein [Deltaproteobacteria bacterium]
MRRAGHLICPAVPAFTVGVFLTVTVFLTGVGRTAHGRPLTLAELYDLGAHVGCVEACPPLGAEPTYDEHVSRQVCLAACGQPPRLWEKNGVAPVDRVDHELALLEYQDAQDPTRELVCYRDEDQTIVVPGALCAGAACERSPECTEANCDADPGLDIVCTEDEPGGPRCWWPQEARPPACPDVVCRARPDRNAVTCADVDGDGLPAWLEDHLGRDPLAEDALCTAAAPCDFGDTCSYRAELGAGTCDARPCGDGCTAFHLELVAEDDQEVLIHVHYDRSPVPARVLDLYMTYDRHQLALADARPLAPLRLAGKL